MWSFLSLCVVTVGFIFLRLEPPNEYHACCAKVSSFSSLGKQDMFYIDVMVHTSHLSSIPMPSKVSQSHQHLPLLSQTEESCVIACSTDTK